MFKQFTARIGIPSRRSDERKEIERAITDAYPGMQIRFKDDFDIRLIGVEAPDQRSAALVLPLLEKIISDLDQNREKPSS